MNTRKLRNMLILLILLLNSSIASGKAVLSLEPNTDIEQDGVHLLAAGNKKVVFSVVTPWKDLQLEQVDTGEKSYLRISIPGWSSITQPGAPALPLLIENIAVPFGVDVEVRVKPGAAHTQVLARDPLPVVSQVLSPLTWMHTADQPMLADLSHKLAEDATIYTGSAIYPGELARVTVDGIFRQQRVLGIAVYPVQYHPQSRELTIYESMTIELVFSGEAAAIQPAPLPESQVFEEIYRQGLLNYESARQWRQPPQAVVLRDSGSLQVAEGSGEFFPIQKGTADELAPWSPPAPAWRVLVRADGFYRLTYSELQAAGLAVDDLDPQTFQLYHLGQETAIQVTGEQDSGFDPDDTLIFYGQALDNKYTQDNVYWLTYGQQPGMRMLVRDGSPGDGQTPTQYLATKHFEQNKYYLSLSPGDEKLERWLWDFIYAPSKPNWTYSFTLSDPVDAPAKVEIGLLGYLQNIINPDHHVQVFVNNTLLDEFWWDDVTWYIDSIDIPQGLLVAGVNTIKVVCVNDTGVGYDIVYVNHVKLEFPNHFSAEKDQLVFTYETPGEWKFQVDGFSTDQVFVYDVTNPFQVSRIEGIASQATVDGYAILFQDELIDSGVYHVESNAKLLPVQAIEPDIASNLQSTTPGADYILITHKAFTQQAQTLVDFRASKRLRSVLVDVQDVYDEFGYGIRSAEAIHEFLAYTYSNWTAPAPAYVVLLGDGNYDPKNYLGYGRESFIPPYLVPVDPWIGETAADNRFVTLAGNDTMPEMMLGRLSVNTPAEAAAFVDKILAFEQNSPEEDWRKAVLTVADNEDTAGDFDQISDDLLNCCLSNPYQPARVYLGVTHASAEDARAAIMAEINAGKLLVNYSGHASTVSWASENLLGVANIPQMQNGEKTPVFLAMTCREGYFHSPNPVNKGMESFAESVTRAEGKGAVASWSPTGLGVASGHDYLNRGFFSAFFFDGARTIGQATLAGKLDLWASGGALDLLDTYLLFGDPAMGFERVYTSKIYMPLVVNAAE